MQPWQYLDLVRRWAWLLILGSLLAAGVGYVVSRSLPPVYQATATLMVVQVQPDNPLVADYSEDTERLVRAYTDLMKAKPVLETAARSIGLSMGFDDLTQVVNVRRAREAPLLQITVDLSDPVLARDLADAVATTFIAQTSTAQQGRFLAARDKLSAQLAELGGELEQRVSLLNSYRTQVGAASQPDPQQQAEIVRLDREVAELQQTYAIVQRSYEDLRLSEARSLSGLLLVERAELPTSPARPRVLLNTLLAALAGLLLALASIVLKHYLNDTLAAPEQLETVGLSPLAVVGEFSDNETSPLVLYQDHAPHQNGRGRSHNGDDAGVRSASYGYHSASRAEAYQVLRTSIQFTGLETPLRTVLVTSSGPGDGKTTTAANLAVALAQAGFQTLLVDADLRNPSLHRLFGLPNHDGLTTLLLRGGAARRHAQRTAVPQLSLLPSGPVPPNPSALLGSRKMSAYLEELRDDRELDYVIIDSPPTLVSDAIALASQVDGVVVVLHASKSSSRAALRTRWQLEKVGARILGAVLNHATVKATDYAYADYVPTTRDGAVQRDGVPEAGVSPRV